MKEKRGRPAIKPSIKQLICAKALKDKDAPRLALAVELKNLIEEMGEISPSEETMMKLISQARNHPVSELDKPWSIARLDDYPIPPKELPKVIREYRRHMDEGTEFTIRQAKWVARLSDTECPESLPDIIAKTEQLYEILGELPDFDVFDKLLAGLPGQSDNWQVPFAAMASLAGILKNDPTRKEAQQNERVNSAAR